MCQQWRASSASGGFTYLVVLLAVAFLGIALAAVGTVWAATAQRDREAELLFAGHAFRNAIASYYFHGAGGAQYPRELADLIEDSRGPVVQRHLRRIYVDPMTGRADWEIVRGVAGEIVGVRSSSHGTPIKRANFSQADAAFADADCYCDWQFIFVPVRYARTVPKH